MDELMNATNPGINPLMDFARKVECSVKIPSQGLLYDEDTIEFNAIGEVDIMPMLPNDELSIVNPESLISGDAIIGLIKSCCPGVKRPEDLYYPDVNVILLGIRKATYGDELIQTGVCPECWKKKLEIEEKEMDRISKEKKFNPEDLTEDEAKELYNEASKNVAEKISEMEKNNEIHITPVEFKYNIDDILSKITLIPKETYIETKDGLKIYLTPYKCKDKILFSQRSINEQKVLTYYHKTLKNEKLTNENITEYLNKTKKMVGMYTDITDKTIDILAKSILKIILPDGRIIDNPDFIREYIKNISSDLVVKLNNEVVKLNEYGIKSTLEMECPCCKHKWDEKFYGFNQSDFFGISS